jgi:hypothetical protein
VAYAVAHVHLAIELDSDPIKGQVSADGTLHRPFNGWIELVEVLEDVRAGAPGSASEKRLGVDPGANGSVGT